MIDQKPKRSDEPIFWGLFGAGGTWFAMLTPVTILVLGIFVPLGIIDAEALSYHRMIGFMDNLLGALIVIASISLPAWHAMHRVHHGLHDLKFHIGTFGVFICYALAFIATILSVTFVVML